MPFKKILVALDGSKNSQIAAEYAFWLASSLDAEITGIHVVDPRLVDYFIEPEFGEELGFGQSVETADKVFVALRKIGKTILDLFAREAATRSLRTKTFLSEGHIFEEILKYSEEFDLLVLGHRGRSEHRLPARILWGSLADRVARDANISVLIPQEKQSEIKEVLVAFDGSEASVGALLMAENLVMNTDIALRALTVIPSADHHAEAQLLVEKGEKYLREYWSKDVFMIKEGSTASTILKEAHRAQSLLVLGAYGYRNRDENTLGSTTAGVINRAQSSVLIYRPPLTAEKRVRRSAVKQILA